jgi:hypothetical protein
MSLNRWAYLRMAVVVLAIALFALFAACSSSDDKGKTPEAGDTPASEQSPTDGGDGGDGGDDVTPTDSGDGDGGDGGGGSGGDAFSDVPLPEGAEEQSEITISGSQFPLFVPTEAGVDAEAFGDVTVRDYTVGSSPGDVVDFYKDNQGDWDEAYAITSSDGGLIIWASDDGKRAVWISAGEGTGGSDTASLVIYYGETQ